MMPWPKGARAAVSLSFDDARSSQAERGLEFLHALGIKATFYVTVGSMVQHLDAWKRAVAAGHEIGNHSMTHPCSGNFEWARKNALEDYTLERMLRDIEKADDEIHRLLGVRPETFAYPCGQKFIGRGKGTQSYVPLIASRFRIGRGYRDSTVNDPGFFDPAQTLGVEMDGGTFEELKPLLDEAVQRSAWLVLVGHEVGDTPAFQTTLLQMIESLAAFCRDNGVWIDTVDAVATHILKWRETRC